MQKVFLDTDVLLDLLLDRKPYIEDSQKIFSLIESGLIKGHTSSLIMANIYYIIEKHVSKSIAVKSLQKIRSILKVLAFTDKEIGEGLNSNFKDKEDAFQYYIALNNRIKTIITKNTKDYKDTNCKVFSPSEYLKLSNTKKILNKLDE